MDDRRLDLAAHWLDVGRPQRALDELDAAGGAGASPEALWLRGRALLALERWEDSERVAATALAQTPDSVYLLALLGDARLGGGRLAAAEQALLSALHLDPENVAVLCRYATLLARAGQADKAAKVLDRAATIEPDADAVTAARALVDWAAGRDRDTAARARQLLESDPDGVAGHRLAGLSAGTRGRWAPARRHFDHVAASDPGDADAAELARATRVAAHPALLPLRAVYRFGPGPVWVGALALAVLLLAVGWDAAALTVIAGYLLLAVYSWIAPPLVRRFLSARRP